jgi:hypothetical protein
MTRARECANHGSTHAANHSGRASAHADLSPRERAVQEKVCMNLYKPTLLARCLRNDFHPALLYFNPLSAHGSLTSHACVLRRMIRMSALT